MEIGVGEGDLAWIQNKMPDTMVKIQKQNSPTGPMFLLILRHAVLICIIRKSLYKTTSFSGLPLLSLSTENEVI